MDDNRIRNLKAGDIVELSAGEAQAALDVLTTEADIIQSQINNAVAQFHKTGERSDPEWFSRATSAMKVKRRIVMRLQQHLKALKRLEYERGEVKKNVQSYECCFVKIAQKLLNDDTFEQIAESARTMSMQETVG